MNLSDYQREAHNTAVYPEKDADTYLAAGFVGECGEALNQLKKVMRGDCPLEEKREHICKEIGGALWYLAEIAGRCGLPLEDGDSLSSGFGADVAAEYLIEAVSDVIHGMNGQSFVVSAVVSLELAAIAIDSTLGQIAADNLKTLQSRQQRGVLQGDGDER